MLGSQAASWVGLGVAGLPAVVPVAVFYWLWAVKNLLVDPLWSDLGVVTFGLVLASEYTPGRNRYGVQGVHLNPQLGPGPLPMHLHTSVYMEYAGCLPTLLNPLAKRTCFS
jgi:hypothetical protein